MKRIRLRKKVLFLIYTTVYAECKYIDCHDCGDLNETFRSLLMFIYGNFFIHLFMP